MRLFDRTNQPLPLSSPIFNFSTSITRNVIVKTLSACNKEGEEISKGKDLLRGARGKVVVVEKSRWHVRDVKINGAVTKYREST